MRYDQQIADKCAFSLKFLKSMDRDHVTAAAYGPLFKGANLAVELDFYMTVLGKQKIPDLDNLVKFTLDAMQSEYLAGVIWKDDQQVCDLRARRIVNPDRNAIAVTVSKMEG